MNNKKCFKWIKNLLIVLSLIAIVVAYYELKFFDILIGSYQLEKNNKKIARVSQKALIYIMKSKETEDVFFDEMKKIGWMYYDTYGRGYIFTKNGEEILVTKSNYFSRYTVFEIHNRKYFNMLNK